MPSSDSSGPHKDDFITRHGKRIVVIIFSILVGDSIPAIIQHGLKPNELFYTIVLVTIPYTGALVTIFLVWGYTNSGNPYFDTMFAGIVVLIFFVLATYLHWGISDTEANQVASQMQQVNQGPYGTPERNPVRGIFNMASVVVQFYINKYGLPLFISATLAAFVITWDILTWSDKPPRQSSRDTPVKG